MSRTKGKSAKEGDDHHQPRHVDHEPTETHEHPVAKDLHTLRKPRPVRSRVPNGATDRRRMSYGYRQAPRHGGR